MATSCHQQEPLLHQHIQEDAEFYHEQCTSCCRGFDGTGMPFRKSRRIPDCVLPSLVNEWQEQGSKWIALSVEANVEWCKRCQVSRQPLLNMLLCELATDSICLKA